ATFKSALLPEAVLDDKFFKTCVAEVNVISLFFPDIVSEAVLIIFTAWLAFACVMDDVLETLDQRDRELVLWETIQLLAFGKEQPLSILSSVLKGPVLTQGNNFRNIPTAAGAPSTRGEGQACSSHGKIAG